MAADRVSLTPRQLGEIMHCEPTLQAIFGFLLAVWPDGEDCDVTCIWRTAEEEAAAGGVSGIHTVGPPYRAIDVRVKNIPGDAQAHADRLGSLVNARYQYDATRPEKMVAFTQQHGTGPHIHLQVCSATARRLETV